MELSTGKNIVRRGWDRFQWISDHCDCTVNSWINLWCDWIIIIAWARYLWTNPMRSYICYLYIIFQETLDLSHNLFSSPPEGMKRYWGRSLQYLDLSYNKLESLPQEIVAMRRLLRLNMSRNFIRALPHSEFWQCRKLGSLNLASNQLGSSVSLRYSKLPSVWTYFFVLVVYIFWSN